MRKTQSTTFASHSAKRMIKFTFKNPQAVHKVTFINITIMYLKFIRHPTSSDTLRIGSLYRVHFKPNMMGGYTEILTFICYAYEIIDHQTPSALIYPLTIRNVSKRLFLNYGLGKQHAMLYLPYSKERDTLLSDIQHAINHRQDIRIDICEP